MKYIIDAFAWIEYLEGSEKGRKVYDVLNSDSENLVLLITISEVVSKIKRKSMNYELAYESMIKNAKIFDIIPRIAKEAGLLHAQYRKEMPQFGIVDALLITTAKHLGAKVMTGDQHFKQFKNVVLI
jgi:predicted nucleic acid-binding protein